MDKVIYIVGAGFSAPLNIPVMSNFLFKSKDLYFSDTTKYSHFNQVFETINKLSAAKNYYNCDLFNIEEILSIIEMNEFLEGNKLQVDFINYIKDVISYYTPKLNPISENLPGNWQDFLFGRDHSTSLYGYFVSSLMGLSFSQQPCKNPVMSGRSHDFIATKNDNPNTKYSVLSLNYDMILENIAQNIQDHYKSEFPIAFEKKVHDPQWNLCHIAKLHGCLSENEIVPPTWAKGTHNSIIPVWKNAYKLLNDANHIRFIGYSLPVADSYLKYLLKAAVIDAPNLKSLDVICIDQDGQTEQRYRDFFEFNNFSFRNGSVTDYLSELETLVKQNKGHRFRSDGTVNTSYLEDAHNKFMKNSPINEK
jgi:hypothetical protein